MIKLVCPHVQTDRRVAILAVILIIVRQKISAVDIGKEFD